MSTTHTPGPWTKSNNVRQQDDAQRIYAGDMPVATVHHLPQKNTAAFYEAHANARLIAAAPDLLAALLLCKRFIDGGHGLYPGLHHEAYVAARDAIAKAEGQL